MAEVLADLVHLLPEEVQEQAQMYIWKLQEQLERPEAPLVLGLVFGALLLVVVLACRPGASRKRSGIVVLAGPSAAGKTTLFLQLRDGSLQYQGTVASMQESEALVKRPRPGGRGAPLSVRLADVPGHHKLRHRLDTRLRDARGVVFVLDAVEVTPKNVEAAELLYEVLTHPDVVRRRLPVLLACNKADLEAQAHSTGFITKTLEKQLEAVRKSRATGIGKAGATEVALGRSDKPFSFQDFRNNKVTVVETSALTGALAPVDSFLASL